MNRKITKVIKTIICIVSFIALVFASVIISANLTAVLNPVSSVYNISKVMLDKDALYVTAQNKPWKVMFSKSYIDEKSAQDILDDFMSNDGYEMSDRNGSLIIYKNEKGNERRIHISVNKYYSVWEWV